MTLSLSATTAEPSQVGRLRRSRYSLVALLLLLAWAVDAGAGGPVALSGRVFDCFGGATGVAVELHRPSPFGGAPVVESSTETNGAFRLDVPATGIWDIRLRRADGLELQRRIPVFHPTVVPPVELPRPRCGEELPPGWHRPSSSADREEVELAGEVVGIDPQGRRDPIEGAWIWSREPDVEIARTDADGLYRIHLPVGRRVELRADADGRLPFRLAAHRGDDESGNGAEQDNPRAGPRFWLSPAGRIVGRVLPPSLQAFLPIDVRALDPDAATAGGDFGNPERVFTDAEGRFHVLAAPGVVYDLAAHHADLPATSTRVTASRPGGRPSTVTLHLRPGPGVSGRVVDPEGRPVTGARAVLTPAAPRSRVLALLAGRRSAHRGLPTGETGPAGDFHLRSDAPGRHALVVQAPGFTPLAIEDVTLSGDEDLDLGELFLEPGRQISGRVVDMDGEAIVDARLSVALLSTDGRTVVPRTDPQARSDARGRFKILDLAADRPLQVTARAEGFLPATTVLSASSEEELELSLEAAGELHGCVFDSAGEPVEGALVRVASEAVDATLLSASARGGSVREARSDDAGRFAVRGVEPGPLEVRISAACCQPTFRRLVLDPDNPPGELTFELSAGASIEGRVLDPRGRPLAGATIRLQQHSQTTGELGDFHLQGLDPGPVDVSISHPEHGAARFQLRAGEETLQTVQLAERGWIVGRLMDDAGGHVAGQRVVVTNREAPLLREERVSDRVGELSLAVQPGTYRLSASRPGRGRIAEKSVTVAPGSEVEVTLRIPGGTTVFGRVLGAEPRELIGTEVRAAGPLGTVPGALQPEGTYRVEGLSEGSWHLVALLSDGRRAEAQLRIEPDQEEIRTDLELGRGRQLEGLVVINDEPLEGGWIVVSSLEGANLARTVTDSGGRFVVSGLTPERVQVDLVDSLHGLHWSRTVRIRGAPVEIRLRTGEVSGRLVDGTTGNPLENVRVRFEPLGDATLLPRQTTSRPDGRFGAMPLAEGRYLLSVTPAGYRPAQMEILVGPEMAVETDLVLWPTGGDSG